MAARLTAFLAWAALAASVVFWGLTMAGRSPMAPPHTVPVSDVVVPAGDLSRLLGAAPVAAPTEAAATPASSRFQLVGVVAPRGARDPAVALIGVDGNPPRAYRVGRSVDDELVLLGVEGRSASLGKEGGPATVRLELPPPPVAATGTLPPPASLQPPAPQQRPPVQPQPQPQAQAGPMTAAPVPGMMPPPAGGFPRAVRPPQVPQVQPQPQPQPPAGVAQPQTFQQAPVQQPPSDQAQQAADAQAEDQQQQGTGGLPTR